MNIDKVLAASTELATSICACMDRVRNANPDLDPIYGVCLAVSDDFAYLALFANTTSHFRCSRCGMLDKWYFGQWWSQGLDIHKESLVKHLGNVDDIDDTPENDSGLSWLAAMTNAMDIANKQNAFHTGGEKPFLFCSMIDSSNAVWLENLSARFLNAQDIYNELASEISAAQREWYTDATGRGEYCAAFETVLRQIQNAR